MISQYQTFCVMRISLLCCHNWILKMSDSANQNSNQQAASTAGWNIMAMFSLSIATNVAMIILLSLSLPVPTIAYTVLVVFINVMAMIGINSSIDDMQAILKDLDEGERNLNRFKNWLNAPFIMYRVLIIAGFGGTGAAILFALYTG